MTKPAVWADDPLCSHDVACAYQTHYCSYIRVPRLLTLQTPRTPDELWSITVYQWYELWFKVLRVDLDAAQKHEGTSFEPIKLLRRGIELFKLFEQHTDLAETILVRDLALKNSLRIVESEQLPALVRWTGQLSRLVTLPVPGIGAAVREYTAHFQSFRERYEKLRHATLVRTEGSAPTFAEWLHLPELLALQTGVKGEWARAGEPPAAFWLPERLSPDEIMFVVVHQCFELWFQVILAQIDRAIPALLRGEIAQATHLLQRVVLIQRLLVQQIHIPETMPSLDFMRFRHQTRERDGQVLITGLSPASGTESYQFREIEIVSGLCDDPVFQKYLAGTPKLPIRLLTERQAERLKQTTLAEAFRHAVALRGLASIDEIYTLSDVPNPNADLQELAEALIQFDEFFHLWRIHHVNMVEKMIGGQSGTGFLGPEYLMETAGIRIQEKNRIFEERQVRPRLFPELWEVRTRMGK